MTVMVVTGYVPSPEHPRSEREFRKLGEQFPHLDVPTVRFEGSIED
jgi:hypothetical protein